MVKFPTEAMQTSVSTHTGGRPPKGTAEESSRCSLEPGIPRAQLCNGGGLGVTAGVLPLLKEEAALCTDMGKVAEGQPHVGCGAQQPPRCRKSHTG